MVRALTERNNGLYTNEWLIGDTKTDEIAMLELGTAKHRLRRSGRDEWVCGTKGFYWGCNNTKDLALRLETFASVEGRPHDVSWKPTDRDRAWLKLYREHAGKDRRRVRQEGLRHAAAGRVPRHRRQGDDGALAEKLGSHALFGPPLGKVWLPTHDERTEDSHVLPLVPHPWTVLTADAPPKADDDAEAAVDLHDKVPETLTAADRLPGADDEHLALVAAWHGTLLPKGDDDLWLTAGFAAYERVVAFEKALAKKADGKEEKDETDDADHVAVMLNQYRAGYLSAVAARPAWRKDGTASEIDTELDRGRWHREQVGRGVLMLHALREKAGDKPFRKALDAFGRAHAGREVTAAEFAATVGPALGLDLGRFLHRQEAALARQHDATAGRFTVLSFLEAPEETLIVYGTADDEAANREAAGLLAEQVRKRWSNVTVPVVADRDAADEKLKGRHLLLVGRPSTNTVAARFAKAFPVAFTAGTFTVRDDVYAHPEGAVAAAGISPLDGRYSVVLLAGLSGAATYMAPPFLVAKEHASKDAAAGEVLVIPAGGKAKALVVSGGADE